MTAVAGVGGASHIPQTIIYLSEAGPLAVMELRDIHLPLFP